MGIYLPNMEMPKERESFTVAIKYNGLVFDTETMIQVAEAYEVPPHGRLIDADALPWEKQGLLAADEDWGLPCSIIENAPTVIEAEEGE